MTKVKRPRSGMTWDEYETWLKETGQYEEMVERHQQRDEELEKRWAARDAALEPLEEELRAAGLPSLFDMCSSKPHPRVLLAVPTLIAHLQKKDAYPKDARDLIASALSRPEMRHHWHVLLQLFRDEREWFVKQTLANALLKAADADVLDDIIALVRDPQQVPLNGIFLRMLEKSKDPRAQATLEEVANVPDFREEIKEIHKLREQRKKRKLKKMH